MLRAKKDHGRKTSLNNNKKNKRRLKKKKISKIKILRKKNGPVNYVELC